MKAYIYLGVSVDGYIARKDGSLDWLPQNVPDEDFGEEFANNDFGYVQFMNSIDLIVMGRHTYESVLSFGEWPYQKPVVVLASSAPQIPPNLKDKVSHESGEPEKLINRFHERLKYKNNPCIYIDGGITCGRFLGAGLIHEIIITRIPVMIGSGLPAFGHFDVDIRLQHKETLSFKNGFVQSRYQVLHPREMESPPA